MEEIWKDIQGYEGLYQVSNMGRVKSLERFRYAKTIGEKDWVAPVNERILKPGICRGYCQVVLNKNGTKSRFQVHRLVATAFIPNPENKSQVNHINGNKVDNRLENLEWVTPSENQIHAIKTGLVGPPPQSRPVLQISLGGKFIKRWDSSKSASRELGISSGNIRSCCSGKRKKAGGFIWKLEGG